MLNSIVGSVLNMSAEVHMQQNVQDKNTGSIIREWVYEKTIPCKIEPIKSTGASVRGDNKIFDRSMSGIAGGYQEKLQLKVKSLELLSKRWRISNIRSSDGQQVFVEIDKYNQPDSIFEITSSHAVLDPFGRISYYEATVQRVPIQDNDKTSN